MTDAEAGKVARLLELLPVVETEAQQICVGMNTVCETHTFTIAAHENLAWYVVVDVVDMREEAPMCTREELLLCIREWVSKMKTWDDDDLMDIFEQMQEVLALEDISDAQP